MEPVFFIKGEFEFHFYPGRETVRLVRNRPETRWKEAAVLEIEMDLDTFNELVPLLGKAPEDDTTIIGVFFLPHT